MQELYEPLWEELLSRTTAAGIAIRSIWMADVAHQGASGALNEEKLGGERTLSSPSDRSTSATPS